MFQTATRRFVFDRISRAGFGVLIAACGICLAAQPLSAEDWPQWRGLNCTGVTTSKKPLPVEFSPTKNVRWSAEPGDGIGSPTIVAGRLFTTAMLGEKPGNRFVVFCFDAATGRKQWERELPIEGEALPKIHESNSYASATPAADEDRVYVYHARLGMMAFDAKTGETVWRRALPEPYFVFDWGPGMSPVIHGDRLFFCQDDDLSPAAYCLDKKTGEILWKDDRGDMACSYSHPVICETPQGPEVVIAGTGKMIGYDYNTGHRKWATEVFCRNIKTTPVTFDGIIYVSVESFGISYQWRVTADANGDGKITRDEILNNKYRLNTGKSIPDAFWAKFDRGDENRDGVLEGDEIDKAFLDPKNRGGLLASEVQARLGDTIDTDADKLSEELSELQKDASIQAVRGGGEGDVSKTHVLWMKKTKSASHIVSPLVADGRMFLIKQGGITASFLASNGEQVWDRRRVGADGSYLSAPVYGDGKIYVTSEPGVVSVIESGPEQKVLANNDFGEPIAATPALVDGQIFVRTRTRLYCIADEAKPAEEKAAADARPDATADATPAAEPSRLAFSVMADRAVQELSPEFCWFHPRAAAVPGAGRDGKPAVIMTLMKHLAADDHYSGLYFMRTDDLGQTWTGPAEIPELAWRKQTSDITAAVIDTTPGWHAQSGRLLVIGAKTLYTASGDYASLQTMPHSYETSYATWDPASDRWSGWKELVMPEADGKFFRAGCGCSQWLVNSDGSLFVPIQYQPKQGGDWLNTVLHCSFDGTEMKYLRHGTEFSIVGGRGFAEPSLALFQGKYYLTLRNDASAYVATSDDGLNFSQPQAWTFDDGKELGSYNTQAHWLTHSDGLFLSYTRRGANNDHIARHRAPLFVAQVNPQSLQVMRSTEQLLLPERGVMLGNFGASAITPNESWVTDAEFISRLVEPDAGKRPHPKGADGTVWVGRVKWSKPNLLAKTSTDGKPQPAATVTANRGEGTKTIVTVSRSTPELPRKSEGDVIELTDGRLLLVSMEFGGDGSDFATTRFVSHESSDGGLTWGQHRLITATLPGDLNVYSPNLIRAKDGAILLLFMRQHRPGSLTNHVWKSTDEGKTFSPLVEFVAKRDLALCNATVKRLASGRLLLPASPPAPGKPAETGPYSATMLYSDDDGRTWHVSESRIELPMRGAMEPHVEQTADGRVLMVMRNQLGKLFFSESKDDGATWSPPFASSLTSPESCPELTRIPGTNDLLMIWNNSYDPMFRSHFGKRSPLTAAVSKDHGKTWQHVRDIETDPTRAFSNPGCRFTRDGRAIINYWTCEYLPNWAMQDVIDIRVAVIDKSWFYGEATDSK